MGTPWQHLRCRWWAITKNQKRNNLPCKMMYLRVANVYADKILTDDVYKIGVTAEEA